MIPISNPSARLQAFLGSAATDTVKFTVGYINMPPQSVAQTQAQRGSVYRSVSNGVTDVQIAPFPGRSSISSSITIGLPGYAQNIFYIKVYNSDASSVTITIQIEDGSDDIQIKVTLATLESLYYEDGRGWYSTDANGAIKTQAPEVVASGTYVPTLTNDVNVGASVASTFQYSRVGSVVTVSGFFTIDPTTTATSTELGISLPIASNFASAGQCAGVASAIAFVEAGGIRGDATNDRAELVMICQTNSNHSMYCTFTYLLV